jgi:hypothetical protein
MFQSIVSRWSSVAAKSMSTESTPNSRTEALFVMVTEAQSAPATSQPAR